MVDDDEVGDEYANCKPSSTGESFCKKKSDKCIPDQPVLAIAMVTQVRRMINDH